MTPSPRETIAAARAYCLAEATRLATADPLEANPGTVPDLSAFPDATLDVESVLVTIEEGHQPRRLDAPIFLFVMAATAWGGFFRLNSRETGKREGVGKLFPRLDFPGNVNIQLNRIVANARPGEIVRENRADHRDHMPEGLAKVGEERPSYKNNYTRADCITQALAQFDKRGDDAGGIISRAEYEGLLWQLLVIADLRAANRAEMAAQAMAPWAVPA